jgi:hypothetical protein
MIPAEGSLRALLLGRYPSVTAIAKALDVSYTSVHRYLSLRSKEQREAYVKHVAAMFELAGDSKDAAARQAAASRELSQSLGSTQR